MQTLNKHGLPEAIYNVLSGNKPPVKGRYSVTDLIGSPLQRVLKMKHWDELEEDVSDKLWMLLGRSVHYVLEQGAPENALAEEKLVISYKGVQVVGIADLFHNGTVEDYKVVSAFSFLLGEKPEWTNQLNVYGWIYRMLGFAVTGLRINAILRDHMKSKAQRDPDYPQIPFQTVDVALWDFNKQGDYLDERIAAHIVAEETGIALPCTDEEKWAKPTTFAVMKKGLKRASRVLDSQEEAEEWATINIGLKGWEIQERPGEYTKCLSYCAVREVCEYNPHRAGQTA